MNENKVLTPPKGYTQLAAEIDDFRVWVVRQPSKTGRGKDRVWFRIDQEKRPRTTRPIGTERIWRIGAALTYHATTDILFEREPAPGG